MKTQYDHMSDETLTALFHDGDTAAMDFLMERYKGFVRTLTQARFLTGGDRDDLIQEGMIGLYKAIRDYEEDKGASFRTFAALCITRQMNHAIETSTRDKNKALNDSVPLPEEDLGYAHLAMLTDSPERKIVDRESVREQMDAINALLSQKEQQVLRYYLQGKSYQEMADRMQCSVKSIDNTVQRIRTKAKKIVSLQ